MRRWTGSFLLGLIVICVSVHSLPAEVVAQRIRPIRTSGSRSTSIFESPFRALGEWVGIVSPPKTPARLPDYHPSVSMPREPYPRPPASIETLINSIPGRQGTYGRLPRTYRSSYPSSESDLEKLINDITRNPKAWSEPNLLSQYPYLTPPSILEASTEEVKRCQKMLKSLGYYSGRVDGLEGPKTQEATSSFIAENFPNLPGQHLISSKYATDLADPQKTSLIALSYDLASSARVLNKLDRDQRLALINRSSSILGYSEEADSMDIYISSKQLTDVGEKGKYVLNSRDKTISYSVPNEPGNLIVVRYYPQRTRKKFDILSGTAATAQFYEHVANQVRQRTSDQNRTIALIPSGKSAHVVTADGIFSLSAQQVTSLKRGKPLTARNPLSSEITKAQGKSLVILNHPLSQKSRGMRQTIGQLAFGLQRSYPQARIVRSDFSSDHALDNMSALMSHEIKGPEDVVVIIDRSSDRVQTFGAIENSRPKLEASGIRIVDYTSGMKWEGGRKKSMIVITGHIDARLAKLVEKLCEDGYFDGNFVVFNSCYELTGLSTRLVEAVRQKGGALAVFRFNTRIHPLKVRTFLEGITQTVEQRQPITLFDLIFRNLPPSMSGGWEAHNLYRLNKDGDDAGS